MKPTVRAFLLSAAALFLYPGLSAEKIHLKLIETTDVHGCFYPEDFINRTPAEGSLARVCSFLSETRQKIGAENVILLDNGDILQGQPTVYYYNYIDTASPHLTSEMMNYLGYDASTIGNHDVETGHAVYDRWISQNRFPVLGANVIDTSTGKPYLKPYTVIERNGIRIAVMGMLTPAIPGWLPENLWSGLRFDDMTQPARHWVNVIKEKEKPDLLVGLFHSGRDSLKTTGDVTENASMLVARHVPGFDIIMMGHDHSPYVENITNDNGGNVLVINPANAARRVADIDVLFDRSDDGSVKIDTICGNLTSVDAYTPDEQFMNRFSSQRDSVEKFISNVIGHIDSPLTTRDAYFGPSAFIDFIHSMQLEISGAEISFAAPLSFDATIPAGDIHVSDMFNLYKYENMLYTMTMTGQEIKDYLEMSYDLWTNTMASGDDHLLKLRENPTGDDMTHTGFINPSYNFDSAAGIIYTVDVTRPAGQKIEILSMSDSTPFEPSKTYRVAVNSYRGNGGGNLMTDGAGIPTDELQSRIITSTDKDLRYYLMNYISSHSKLDPKPSGTWRFVPEAIATKGAKRDKEILFGK